MLVWSSLGVYFCGALSVPALIMTILASRSTSEEACRQIEIARKFNIASMFFGAAVTAVILLYYVFFCLVLIASYG